MNCIEACFFKEIKNKYNCNLHSTIFSIQGFRQCPWHYLGLNNYNRLKSEFSESCLKECPLESCFSEKFFFYTTSLYTNYNFTRFRFTFRELSTLNITQIPKTDPYTFLNNIGGGLGLSWA